MPGVHRRQAQQGWLELGLCLNNQNQELQRLEQRFPKGKSGFLLEFARVISNVQTGAFELVK